jgi:hypothetical protein
METEKDTEIEHQNVPASHQSLHSFLYSSEDEHSATEAARVSLTAENEGAVVPLQEWCDRSSNAKIAGVYAVLDRQQCTQYIGYSRNVLLSLNGHLSQNGAACCAFVRVQAFKYPKRTEMESLRDAWIAELEDVPPGNDQSAATAVQERWAGTIAEVAKAAMSATERNAYEEKKLKLQKAMADTTIAQDTQTETATERMQNLEAAVQNDDWSSVIQTQTEETH